MVGSKIIGLGKAIPSNIVKNDDLKQWMDTSDEWIRQRTGIEQRCWVGPETGTADLAYLASEQAISDAGIEKNDIELIIFATLSPDHFFPGSGCLLQSKLELAGVPALDIRQQCTGFLYGLSIADQFIKTGKYKNILLVGAEIHSKGLDLSDEGRDVAVLFGDGAGAVVIQACDVADSQNDPHIIDTDLYSDGKYASELWVEAPGFAAGRSHLMDQQSLEEGLHFPKMNGKTVFVHAVKRMAESLGKTLAQRNLQVKDVDLFLFHQANLRINQKVAEVLEIPEEKVFNTIMKYGNTTAATLPIGMADAREAGVLRPGMLVGMAAFGSGFTWASSLLRF